jgi:hypothetical protein
VNLLKFKELRIGTTTGLSAHLIGDAFAVQHRHAAMSSRKLLAMLLRENGKQ